MAVTKDEILDAISKMSVMDVVELIADMEKKFNVTAAAPLRRRRRRRARVRRRLRLPKRRPSLP